jgi:hypothetical protein
LFAAARTRFAVGDFGDPALLFGVPTGLLFVGPTGRLMHGTP